MVDSRTSAFASPRGKRTRARCRTQAHLGITRPGRSFMASFALRFRQGLCLVSHLGLNHLVEHLVEAVPGQTGVAEPQGVADGRESQLPIDRGYATSHGIPLEVVLEEVGSNQVQRSQPSICSSSWLHASMCSFLTTRYLEDHAYLNVEKPRIPGLAVLWGSSPFGGSSSTRLITASLHAVHFICKLVLTSPRP